MIIYAFKDRLTDEELAQFDKVKDKVDFMVYYYQAKKGLAMWRTGQHYAWATITDGVFEKVYPPIYSAYEAANVLDQHKNDPDWAKAGLIRRRITYIRIRDVTPTSSFIYTY